MSENLNCPKCSSPMEKGVKLDFIGSSQVYPAHWMLAKNAEILKISSGKTVNLLSVPNYSNYLLSVITHRCTVCGFLEEYANKM